MDQCATVGAGIRLHLLLHDDGALVLMNVFDRVLNGDDLTATLAVDEAYEVIQCGGLARASGTRDQNQPMRTPGKIIDFFRQSRLPKISMQTLERFILFA